MKKLFAILLLAGASAFTAQAQNQPDGDRVIIHEGKPRLMHGNTPKPMLENVTMEDGAMVTTEGVYVAPDGTTAKLNEGDAVYITGKRVNAKPQKVAPKAATATEMKH